MAKLTKLHRQNIKKMAQKRGLDIDSYDYEAKWDTSLTHEENYSAIAGDLEQLSQQVQAFNQAESDEFEKMALEQERAFLRDQQMKDYEDIKKSTTPQLDGFFQNYADMLDILVKSEDIHSLVSLGIGGIGKTYKAIQELSKKGINFVIHNGNISALELYHILYHNRKNTVLIFDDTHALLQNRNAMSLLLSALYSASGRTRICEWRSTTKKLKAPPIFEFESKIVFIANDVPKNIQPLLSRCFNVEVTFTYHELLSIMYEIAKLNHPNLTKKQRFEVVDWLRENTDETTKDFNLRLQKKVELVYVHKKTRWKSLAKSFVTQDESLALVKKILEENTGAKAQIKAFREATGMSRATFYRLKARVA